MLNFIYKSLATPRAMDTTVWCVICGEDISRVEVSQEVVNGLQLIREGWELGIECLRRSGAS